MCAAMLAATAIPANFAMADETKDAENLTEWAMDEPVTLTVLKNQNPATVNYADGENQYNNVYYNAYRDNLGITLDFQICASGDEYSQKVTLAIASDDLPDLLYLPVAEYSQLAEAGKLAPLDDVLEQYGSELTKKNLNSDGGKILEAAKRNDVLYGIPSGNAERIPSQFLWIRKDWLDKLGLDVPKTLDDVVEVARAFKNDDPDGNGVDDTWGLGVCNEMSDYAGYGTIEGVVNAFGGSILQYMWMPNDDGTVSYEPTSQETRNALEKLAAMYSEGLINEEFGVSDTDAISEAVAAGTCGLFYGTDGISWGAGRDAIANNNDCGWMVINAPSVEGGDATAYSYTNFDYVYMVSILREQFPDMRVLFLTGYDDFSFAYEAFRQHAVQYILKTEGDEVVLAALKKEIDRLRENEKIMERINDAEERYTQMLPAYRRQLIMQLMLNQKGELDELEERMLAGELYLVVGLLQGDHNHHVKTKMITAGAVSQIVAGSFGKELAWSEYYLFDDVLIWVFDFDTKQSVSKTLFHLMRKARQQLEEQLKVTMFFIVSEEAVNGLDLNEKYVQIRTMLTNEILRGSTGVAIRHQADVEGKEVENAKKVSEMRRNLENIQLLVRKGSIAEAKNDINEVIAYLTTHSQTENLLAVEAAQSLNAAILSYVNRNGMISLIVEAEHSGAMGTVAYFKKLQELLVNEAEKRIDNTVKSVAKLVVKYINSHISENVSTSVLSDVTGYSSGYLSRIFRQEIGMSIHDYVAQTRMNLAKEMLVNTNLKIYEVAENCGYENTTYFIKIFRISTGITPQDYRLKGKH